MIIVSGGVSAQSCLPSGITFTSQSQVDSFQSDYPGCTEIEGGVVIRGEDIVNLNGLSVLTAIGGTLEIGDDDGNNPMLTSLTGLDNLLSVGIGIGISGNENLASLNGLQNLVSVGYLGLGIYNNDALTDLTGLNSLETITGGFALCGNDGLVSLNGLQSLTSIGGNFWLGHDTWGGGGNSSLFSADGIENLASIGDGLSITDNDLLADLSAFAALSSIGSDIKIGSILGSGNPLLTSLAGLENLDTIPGSIILANNAMLTSLAGLDNVAYIGSRLRVQYSPNSDFSGLSSLTRIGGDLMLEGNPNLVSLAGLENCDTIGGDLSLKLNPLLESLINIDSTVFPAMDNLVISDNESLSYCEIMAVCEYLHVQGGSVTIENNATGCSSQDEVEAICFAGMDAPENQSHQPQLIISPNPARQTIKIDMPGTKSNSSFHIRILNPDGKVTIELKTNEMPVNVNVSNLNPGIYFVILQDNKLFVTGRFIK
jgi:hypothetical protein